LHQPKEKVSRYYQEGMPVESSIGSWEKKKKKYMPVDQTTFAVNT